MQDVCTDQEMRQLIERAKSRDSEALDRLYQLYIEKIYQYIWYRVGDQVTAEDLAMDVFVRMVEHIPRFRIPREQEVAAFSGWLFRIASNRVKDHHRKRARADRYMEKTVKNQLSGETGAPDRTLERIADQLQLREAFQHLSDNQRRVLYYRFVADLTSAQTAAIMKKSESAVKALQYRALISLRRVLGTKLESGETSP